MLRPSKNWMWLDEYIIINILSVTYFTLIHIFIYLYIYFLYFYIFVYG